MLVRAVLLTALAACSFPTKHFAGGGGGDDASMQSDGSAAGDGSGSGIAIADLPAAVQTALCTYQVRCQMQPDMATCKATNPTDTTTNREELAAVAAGKVQYNAAQAQVCIDTITNLTCDLNALTSISDPCNTVFTGTVAVGSPCTDPIECTSQICQPQSPNCDPQTACCMGTCNPAPAQIAIGQPCSSASRCVDGAYCKTNSNPAVCTAQATAVGQSCGGYDGCKPPLSCAIDPLTGAYSTCFMPAAENAQCDPNQGEPCLDLRDFCNRTSKICTHDYAVGSSCDAASGSRCVGYAYCGNGACQELPTPGQACPSGISCLGEARCVNGGTCMLPTPVDCAP